MTNSRDFLSAAQAMLRAIGALYRADIDTAPATDPDSSDLLRMALMCLHQHQQRQPGLQTARAKPVAAALITASGAGPAVVRDCLDAFIAFSPLAEWRQNPNYADAPSSFLDAYGYVELVGPTAPYVERDWRVGVLALRPHTIYPEHAHPAEEVYHPLTQGSSWWRQGEPWRQVEAGQRIYHPSGLPHATSTEGNPLLAVYLWRGAITVEAQLVGTRV